MKVLSLCCTLLFVAVLPLAAQDATGGFHLTLDGGSRMQIEFQARATDTTGGGSGKMKLKTSTDLPDVDEDDPFGQKGTVSDFSFDADFDCVSIDGKRAAMSGLVRSASVVGYVGKRVILTVEDGGEGKNAERDKFTWGLYGVSSIRWIPTDAERKDDDGWSRTWIASDSEREDDRGTVLRRETETDCRSFHLGAYTLTEVAPGGGNIQVRP